MLRTTRLLPFAALLLSSASAQVWEECNVLYELSGERPGGAYGWSGRRAGLVDGDAAQDVVVGAPLFGEGGKAYVYSGATGALLFEFVGGVDERAGRSVGSAGDLNGDGASEVLVGAPGTDRVLGRVYVLDGATGGVLRVHRSTQYADAFGDTVDTVGDVDGDGVADVLVGAPQDDGAGVDAGRAYVFSGATGTLLREHAGENGFDAFGSAGGWIGDRNGDRRGDYVVAAGNGGIATRGRAYVYDGATGNLVGAPLDPTVSGVAYGRFYAGHVGDVDGDAVPDFFVSDHLDGTNGPRSGKAYVYSGADLSLLFAPVGERQEVQYGMGRGFGGDLDRDGRADLFLAAWQANHGGVDAGAGLVVAGRTGEPFVAYHGDTAAERSGSTPTVSATSTGTAGRTTC